MKLAIWSTTTPRESSTHAEMFRRQMREVELAERIGIDQIWFSTTICRRPAGALAQSADRCRCA